MYTKLYGLILSGGKSTRMGSDKGLIEYHGIPQREYLYKLAQTVCEKTFLSIRSEQETELGSEYNYIIDKNEYKGPLNGILSAHREYPKVAWLVLACDLPLLNQSTIAQLVTNRNLDAYATASATAKTRLPEPLVAIWEPLGLQNAVKHMKTAQSSCPRKFLINSDTQLVFPENDEELYNANSLEEYEFAKTKVEK